MSEWVNVWDAEGRPAFMPLPGCVCCPSSRFSRLFLVDRESGAWRVSSRCFHARSHCSAHKALYIGVGCVDLFTVLEISLVLLCERDHWGPGQSPGVWAARSWAPVEGAPRLLPCRRNQVMCLVAGGVFSF